MPAMEHASFAPNSLWRTGSRAFFKDQRARLVGDLVTVKVKVTDRAQLDNTTKRSRKNAEDFGAENAFGFENKVDKFLPNGAQASSLLKLDSEGSSEGSGSVRRSEQLATNVAAVVTQTLPNGNLVIEGKQEIRVNFEVRELIVAGVIRPEDIESDNTIEFDQDRPGPHRLWRARPDHRRPAAALRPAGDGHPAALLSRPPGNSTLAGV